MNDNYSYKVLLSGITKEFPGVIALKNVDFELFPNEVHGLVGKNGAGKSTLTNICCGKIQANSGRVFFEGREVRNLSPSKMLKLGISVIQQEIQILPDLSIGENLFLGELPVGRGVRVKWKEVYERTSEMLKKVNLGMLDPRQRMGSLSVGQSRLISVCKAFFIGDYKIIIMDETTATLNKEEEEILYNLIQDKVKGKASIIFTSHHVEEIFKVCSRVTVLRDGERVGTFDTKSIDLSQLNAYIIGRKLRKNVYSLKSHIMEEEIIRAESLSTNAVKDISFSVRKGEILGIAGIRGSGRSEVFRAIMGLDPLKSGSVYIRGEKAEIKSPVDALKSGICLLSEDKEKEGIISVRSVKENITLSSLRKILGIFFDIFINRRKENYKVEEMINQFNIITPSINQQIQFLSGGNKQKSMISRLFLAEPMIFLLDEPTQGIDIEVKAQIIRLIKDDLTDKGVVIMISSELEDLALICDRIIFLKKGRLIGELQREEFANNVPLIWDYIENNGGNL